MKKIVTISTLKGGQGKSSLSVLLSREAEGRKLKTLVIDMDAQSSLTDYFLGDESSSSLFQSNVLHALTGQKSFAETIRTGLFIDVLPSALNLSTIGAQMSGNPIALMDNRNSIRSLNYDLIIIDSPPSPSYEFRLSVGSADLVISPVLLDRWSFHGYVLLKEEMEKLRRGNLCDASLKIIPSICTPSEDSKIRALFDGEDIFQQSFFKKSSIKNAVNDRKGLKEKHTEERAWIKSIFEEMIR